MNNFMQEAISLAREGMQQNSGGPFGAVIVKDNKIIGRGCNRVTSLNDPTAHAEITAIREACNHLNHFELSNCEIYTSCEPCPMCLCAIYWARISKIYFAANRKDAAAIGFDDDFLYQEVSKPLTSRQILVEQTLRDQALIVFDEWQQKPDKILY